MVASKHTSQPTRPSLRESEEGVDAAAVGNDKRYCDSPTDIVEKRVHPRTVMENPFARRRIEVAELKCTVGGGFKDTAWCSLQ